MKIARDVEAAAAFLVRNDFAGEVLVVDDGSKDDTAKVAGNTTVAPDVHLEVIRYEEHRGKGYAVRKGLGHSSGEYAMFADSGSCVPYDDVLQGLDLLKYGSEVLLLIEEEKRQFRVTPGRIAEKLIQGL